MNTVNVYLTFNGNCLEAFDFYKSVFGGEFSYLGRYKDMPPSDGEPCTPVDAEKIMHVTLPVGGDTVLMGCDSGGEWAATLKQGNNFSLSINADSNEEADRLFNELSKGGQVMMPMNTTFWESYFGMFTDKFGINWMVSFEEKKDK